MNMQLLGMHNRHCFTHYLFHIEAAVLRSPGAVNSICEVKVFGPRILVETAVLWITVNACNTKTSLKHISAIISGGHKYECSANLAFGKHKSTVKGLTVI